MDLSLKPPKKSDLNKAWMKKKLDREIKIHPEYHLIVSEGTDTEPAYFGAIRDIINKFRGDAMLMQYKETACCGCATTEWEKEVEKNI